VPAHSFRAWWNKRTGKPLTPKWMKNAAIIAIAIEVVLALVWLLKRQKDEG
jgi:hypothetical protein